MQTITRQSNMVKGVILSFGLFISSWSLGQQNFDDVEIEVLQVRDNIYMLVGSGGNITVQVGEDGILLVDTQYAQLSDKIIAKVRGLSDGELRYIINTHHHGDHVGGNENIKAAGSTVSGGNVGGSINDAGEGAAIIAHENVLLRMAQTFGQEDGLPTSAWPTSTYFTDHKDLYFNGEGIRILHQPSAHTDGDSIIFFRQSDVITAGDVYRTNGYPFIDTASGGTIQGVIDAANNLVDLIIPVYGQDGGTLIIPGHGRLSDFGDVLNWREMLTIIRDRIQNMVDHGMSLKEVKAAKPTKDYDPRWGSDEGFWTTEDFIETIYQNLSSQIQDQENE